MSRAYTTDYDELSPEETLKALPEDALLLEPRETFDRCLIGVTDNPEDQWPRNPGVTVAVYGIEQCIAAIVEDDDVTVETAWESFWFNTAGAWVGTFTPTFRYTEDETV